MINKKIFLITVLFLSVSVFAQKKEVRNAEKALKKESVEGVKEAFEELEKASSMLDDLNNRYKLRYFKAKAMAHTMNFSLDNPELEEIVNAGLAYKEALKISDTDREAVAGLESVKTALVEQAIEGQKAGKNEFAAKNMLASYELDKRDTIYLYYAAGNFIGAEDYDSALKYFIQLQDLGFEGKQTNFYAVNTETGEKENFANEEVRKYALADGSYEDPEDEVTTSLKGEIAKNISLIYIQKDEKEKAIESIKKAKKSNPDDLDLMQAEADLYYQLGNVEKYQSIMEEIIELAPDNPQFFINLGITADELGDTEGAVEYYKKALELDEDNVDAYLYIAVSILKNEEPIVEQINKLGHSAADNKKFEELTKQRTKYYLEALPYIEKVIELDENNVDATRTLMNIYFQLGEDSKAEKLRDKLREIED